MDLFCTVGRTPPPSLSHPLICLTAAAFMWMSVTHCPLWLARASVLFTRLHRMSAPPTACPVNYVCSHLDLGRVISISLRSGRNVVVSQPLACMQGWGLGGGLHSIQYMHECMHIVTLMGHLLWFIFLCKVQIFLFMCERWYYFVMSWGFLF